MPWEETCPMDQRLKFIAAVDESDLSFAALCREFGISRKTGYKWCARYEALGPRGLEDGDPGKHSCPNAKPEALRDRVCELRKEHSSWGAPKLRALLLEQGESRPPAASTINDWLKNRGLITPRRRRVRTPPSVEPLAIGSQPNEVWCTDFKGHFPLGDKTRCHPLTLTDHASRYLFKCEGLVAPTEECARVHFDRAFREFGLPDRMRSDNGVPFASTAPGGLSALSVWWIKLGIVPERIEPGQPQQNGRHERMHKTLKAEVASPPCATMLEQQRAFDRFRHIYNDRRPHEALGQKTPASRYARSRRAMPSEPRSPEYADTMKTRRVDESGRLKFDGHTVLVTRLLAREPVGLDPIDEETWEIFYGPIPIGELRLRNKELTLVRIT
jgi:transposase InsO family protein